MSDIAETLKSWVSLFPRITVSNVIEIIIIAIIVYMILAWVKNTRSWSLLRGLVVIFIFIILCMIFHLDTILWILGKIATVAVMALVVIFQPELRKALENIGSRSILSNFFNSGSENKGFNEKTVSEIVKASFKLSETKTGALMVIEREDSLSDIEDTGIRIDGIVSSQLLINIFEHNTPLHDGAVVIVGNNITAATCYLPLSNNMKISKSYGTRHRAALGISETTDSLTVVVSEETGKVSVCQSGILTTMKDADQLRDELNKLIPHEENTKRSIFKRG